MSGQILNGSMDCDKSVEAMQNGHAPQAEPEPNEPAQAHTSEDWNETQLLSPFKYICKAPGKHIRTKLAKAFNFWLRIPDERMTQVAEIVQMLHNASLMIDDIEDGSVLRRGMPVAHSIYGVPRTINSANYVYFLALQKTLQLNHPQATQVFNEELLELHRGQGSDIYWRDSVICPTEQQYMHMVTQKTGGLFNLAVRLMQLFSERKYDFKALITQLGLYFQIRDDLMNLTSTDYAVEKTFAEDLTEGKFSFPIIYGIKQTEPGEELINILRQKPTDIEVKKYCVSVLQSVGAFTYTRQVLGNIEQRIADELKKFEPNPFIDIILTELRPKQD